MIQPGAQTCLNCGAPLAPTARYCSRCGLAVGTAGEAEEFLIPGGKRLQVAGDALSTRDLLALVESGVYWWQQKLRDANSATREEAAGALKELSRILDSLSEQLAQGRETVRITTRLPSQRAYPVLCPYCGRGNRTGARFCVACGLPLGGPLEPTPAAPPRLRLDVAARSDRGVARPNNEDMYYTGTLSTSDGPLATLLIVADGMGGAQAGDVASRLACESVKQELLAALQLGLPASDEDWQEVLRRAGTAANQRIYTTARGDSAKAGMGTTLTVVLVVGNRAHLAHVGDSRAYLLNARGLTADGGQVLQLTTDHSLVARLVDIGQLAPEQARSHPQRNMLYRSLGTDPSIEIDTASQALAADDVLLLCSDGVDMYLEDAELARIVLDDRLSPARACEQIITLANQRGGRDNSTVVVARTLRAS